MQDNNSTAQNPETPYPLNPRKYNDMFRDATIAVKINEWVSLIGFQPRHAKFWRIK